MGRLFFFVGFHLFFIFCCVSLTRSWSKLLAPKLANRKADLRMELREVVASDA